MLTTQNCTANNKSRDVNIHTIIFSLIYNYNQAFGFTVNCELVDNFRNVTEHG